MKNTRLKPGEESIDVVENGNQLRKFIIDTLRVTLSQPLTPQPFQDGVYLSWILPLVLQQLLQVNLEGEPALSQVSAQLGHTQQVRLGA